MDKLSALAVFDALSQETRLDVLRLLIQAGRDGIPAGDIAERLGVKQNTMSANLKILSHADLVISTREGRVVRYAANYPAVQGLIRFLMEDCCGGRPELCASDMASRPCDC